MRNKKQYAIFQLASVYIGTVIGAGFASGQEIMKFFTSYGKVGIKGIILAAILHALIGKMILEIVYERQFSSYHEFMKEVMGEKLGVVIDTTVTGFLFVCFSTMLVGAGAILKQAFNVPVGVGAVLMAIIAGLTFLTGSKGFVRMNSLLVPILCGGGLLLGVYINLFKIEPTFAGDRLGGMREWQWLASCITYVAYNTLTVLVVLTNLGDTIKDKKTAKWSGILGGVGLGMLALSIGSCTLIYHEQVQKVEIPMLKILSYYPELLKYIYIVLLLLAMYTTAIANGYGVIENVGKVIKLEKKKMIVIMSCIGLTSIKIGFANIVAYIFPMFGMIGCFEILMLMVYYSFMRWEKKHKS